VIVDALSLDDFGGDTWHDSAGDSTAGADLQRPPASTARTLIDAPEPGVRICVVTFAPALERICHFVKKSRRALLHYEATMHAESNMHDGRPTRTPGNNMTNPKRFRSRQFRLAEQLAISAGEAPVEGSIESRSLGEGI